jgi:hypothetical protein
MRIQAIFVASRDQPGPLFVPAVVSWVALPPIGWIKKRFAVTA